ncbi:hypothetical protein BS641_12985 [Mycobacterium avium subsp. hominissuis]|nr:hypothetical protein BS641_12985 [Mycobacterium avium subsp. hominissuis]
MGSTTQGVDSPNRLGEHAVVLGAGIAGLLAARVLSEFYDSVSVVERDKLPGSVPGSGVSDGGVSVPDVRGPSRESLW